MPVYPGAQCVVADSEVISCWRRIRVNEAIGWNRLSRACLRE
jgi:hypothetical protein